MPEFYVKEACIESNYRYFHDWQELTYAQQAEIVAHYLQKRSVEANTSDAEQSFMEREQKKKGKR